MDLGTLLELSAYLFLLLVLSAFAKIAIRALVRLRFKLSKNERDQCEERFARMAEEASNTPLPLADLEDEKQEIPKGLHLSESCERRYS